MCVCSVPGLGSGSDFTSFLQVLGVTCANMNYHYFVSVCAESSSVV